MRLATEESRAEAATPGTGAAPEDGAHVDDLAARMGAFRIGESEADMESVRRGFENQSMEELIARQVLNSRSRPLHMRPGMKSTKRGILAADFRKSSGWLNPLLWLIDTVK